MVASIAINSGGRFDLGVGVGGDFPAEFAACDVPMATRGQATDRALDLMTSLWRGEAIGPYEAGGGLTLNPLPPGRTVPIWVCGRSSATLDRAVRIGDWWMPYLYSIDKFRRDNAELVARSERAARRCPKAGLHSFVVPGDTREQAVTAATDILSPMYGRAFDPAIVDRLCIVGDSAECVEQIQTYIDAGAQTFCFNLLAEPADYNRRMDQLCTDVLPAFRDSFERHERHGGRQAHDSNEQSTSGIGGHS
jgi:alkanesulfonate monooxygenase SsuD/methylene tetrahydromethanopterin reductase-like flavin-dependent oxidoreductase (luciferase family)